MSELKSTDLAKIEVIFSDIDDTISTEGKILPQAYSALWDLYHAGIKIVPITGRCAGWVDHITRMWPVTGVVGENGAFYTYMDYSNIPVKLRKRNYLSPNQIHNNSEKFEEIKAEIFQQFPTCKVASDQPYREFDLAIDFCEDVPPLSMDEVKKIVRIYNKHGATTKISSIHVNGWFGDFDKLKMTKIFAREVLNFCLDDYPGRAIFIGDSPNDEPMFDYFPFSIGVQNVNKFTNLIKKKPKFITKKPSGLGFAEMVKFILKNRS
ncbi:HAD-IIB family hydrolase [Candidatus Lokiarchaeum ossiferum]